MLAVLSFTLREGSLQLSDTSGEFSFLGPELITELRFSELLFKLDYRPKMKFFKLDASLHSVTMVDHLHPDSLFPTLVQPKGSSVSIVYYCGGFKTRKIIKFAKLKLHTILQK